MSEPRRGDAIDVRQRTCQECGMLLEDAGEYHPFAFCVWKKAGLNPWEAAATVVHALTGEVIRPRVTVREIHEKVLA